MKRFLTEMNQVDDWRKYQIYTKWRNRNKVATKFNTRFNKFKCDWHHDKSYGENDAVILNWAVEIFWANNGEPFKFVEFWNIAK